MRHWLKRNGDTVYIIGLVLFTIGIGVLMALGSPRLQRRYETCLEHGYPALIAGEYCLKQVDGTDVLIPVSELTNYELGTNVTGEEP